MPTVVSSRRRFRVAARTSIVMLTASRAGVVPRDLAEHALDLLVLHVRAEGRPQRGDDLAATGGEVRVAGVVPRFQKCLHVWRL